MIRHEGAFVTLTPSVVALAVSMIEPPLRDALMTFEWPAADALASPIGAAGFAAGMR
jgi:hypothetical protein